MNFKEKLKNYADVIITKGISLKKGQKVEIRASLEDAEFARLLMQRAFDHGAADVNIAWIDYLSRKIKFLNAAPELFDKVYDWEQKRMDILGDEKWCIINITAPDPEVMKEVNPDTIGRWYKSAAKAFERNKVLQMSFETKWVIALGASAPWAEKVFPGLKGEEATEKLWEYIFKVSRADNENCVEMWDNHLKNLRFRHTSLTEKNFKKLKYSGPGTDFEVELIKGSKWVGGSMPAPDGTDVVPNMPTEEVFTVPSKYTAKGTVSCTMPFVYNGNIINGIRLTFEKGKVVDFSAEKGQELLQTYLETDEGASYLGELALVPVDSPIYELNTLFFNTLYDENAACHIALGNALSMCIDGGVEEMSKEDKEEMGFNSCPVHQDIMIGSDKLDILGIHQDGQEEYIFKNGKWAF
ncbi:aminopeptidase [Dethiosulfatibacter aminovorans DSM 17477]|uniref:Aminopeptidase n=1 Tax=Dethiosulfatibacter aminovorans DSM 17477 TaxID=1121476 RepID=A0A1M6KKT0_9FIRM|nr:aminopeptidase [Dethiosulfatibacter aminovorans]SHJ59460.1 aminopeptidase [Dethiosulfatibacter aminovorans DSM 17477]